MYFKGEVCLLHIKSFNKNIYDYIRCSTALLWPTTQSWEPELVDDVTASWKQREEPVHSDYLSKNTINAQNV